MVFINQFFYGVREVLDAFTIAVCHNEKPECVFPQGQSGLCVQCVSSMWASSTHVYVRVFKVESLSVKRPTNEQEGLFCAVNGMTVFVPFNGTHL